MAGGKWISVRFEILASLFVSAVAFSAVIMSQEAGEYVLKKKPIPNSIEWPSELRWSVKGVV